MFREEEGDTSARIASLFESNGTSQDEDELGDQDTTNARVWTLQNKFKNYIYWSRQAKPSRSDKHAKWIEWTTSIAPLIHASLTAEDLTKPLKYTDFSKKENNTTTKDDVEDEEVKRVAKRKEPTGEREGDDEPTKKVAEVEKK